MNNTNTFNRFNPRAEPAKRVKTTAPTHIYNSCDFPELPTRTLQLIITHKHNSTDSPVMSSPYDPPTICSINNDDTDAHINNNAVPSHWTVICFDNANKNKILRRDEPLTRCQDATATPNLYSVCMDTLTAMHERRTEKYINDWGYDEYEKMFLFPNYNYEHTYYTDDELDNNNNSTYLNMNANGTDESNQHSQSTGTGRWWCT